MGASNVLTTLPLQFRTLGSSHSWSCHFCCTPACNTVTSTVALHYNTVTSTVTPHYNIVTSLRTLPVCISLVFYLPPSAIAALPSHPRLQTSYPSSAHSVSSSYASSQSPLAGSCPFTSPASFPPSDSFKILHWNAGGLKARSIKLLHFLSSHPVDLIRFEESNFNSSFSFQIPGFSTLQSDRTHSRSGILSRDATHATGGVIIFVRQIYPFLNFLPSFSLLLTPTLIV